MSVRFFSDSNQFNDPYNFFDNQKTSISEVMTRVSDFSGFLDVVSKIQAVFVFWKPIRDNFWEFYENVAKLLVKLLLST